MKTQEVKESLARCFKCEISMRWPLFMLSFLPQRCGHPALIDCPHIGLLPYAVNASVGWKKNMKNNRTNVPGIGALPVNMFHPDTVWRTCSLQDCAWLLQPVAHCLQTALQVPATLSTPCLLHFALVAPSKCSKVHFQRWWNKWRFCQSVPCWKKESLWAATENTRPCRGPKGRVISMHMLTENTWHRPEVLFRFATVRVKRFS